MLVPCPRGPGASGDSSVTVHRPDVKPCKKKRKLCAALRRWPRLHRQLTCCLPLTTSQLCPCLSFLALRQAQNRRFLQRMEGTAIIRKLCCARLAAQRGPAGVKRRVGRYRRHCSLCLPAPPPRPSRSPLPPASAPMSPSTTTWTPLSVAKRVFAMPLSQEDRVFCLVPAADSGAAAWPAAGGAPTTGPHGSPRSEPSQPRA